MKRLYKVSLRRGMVRVSEYVCASRGVIDPDGSGSSQFIGRRSARTTDRGYSTVFLQYFLVRQGADANQHALSLPYCPFIETNCDVSLSSGDSNSRRRLFSSSYIFRRIQQSIRFFVCAQLYTIPREIRSNL